MKNKWKSITTKMLMDAGCSLKQYDDYGSWTAFSPKGYIVANRRKFSHTWAIANRSPARWARTDFDIYSLFKI